MVSALIRSGAAASTSSGESVSFAPFTTMMRFWPPGSTKIGATPLETPSAMRTWLASIPCDWKFLMVAGPKRSLPTFATMATEPQHRRAATAWFAPLPPKPRSNFLPKMVSPGRGNTSLNVVRSTLALPTTATKDCLAIILPLKIPRGLYRNPAQELHKVSLAKRAISPVFIDVVGASRFSRLLLTCSLVVSTSSDSNDRKTAYLAQQSRPQISKLHRLTHKGAQIHVCSTHFWDSPFDDIDLCDLLGFLGEHF